MWYNIQSLMDEYALKQAIARNIADNRKLLNLTQAELAQRLNYSDKAISKWERGEAAPDIFILTRLAEIFSISVDELISESPRKKNAPGFLRRRKKLIIPLLSSGLVWLVATTVFVLLNIIMPELLRYSWLSFIYAVPCGLIVLIVFNCIWGKPLWTAILVSLLAWSIPLCIFLTMLPRLIDTAWLFLISVPLQVLIVLWYFLKRKPKVSDLT